MSRNSAIIKFGYSHHKEYDDEKAGNKKHSAKSKFCPTPTTISDRSWPKFVFWFMVVLLYCDWPFA